MLAVSPTPPQSATVMWRLPVNLVKDIAQKLEDNEDSIIKELIDCQGSPVDIGGYYRPDEAKADVTMRPSKTLNELFP